MERGYPKNILENASEKAKKQDINVLLWKRDRIENTENTAKVYLVNTYRQNNRGLPEIV